MQCIRPVTNIRPSTGLTYTRNCGTCHVCVISKAAMWTLRIGLESTLHTSSIFVTLTYGPDYIPANASLSKTDAQLFLRSLRHNISKLTTKERLATSVELPLPRYYFVGEYGAQSERPHYHAVLCGLGIGCQTLLEKSWARGHVDLKTFHPNHAAYVARYTTKKSFWQQRPSDGRAPEFSLMSKKPGLGHGALHPVADTIRKVKKGQTGSISGNIRLGANIESLWTNGIPESIRLNGKIYPLGRYLTDQLLQMISTSQSETEHYQNLKEQRLIEREKEQNSLPIPSIVSKRERALTKAEARDRIRKIRSQI